MEKLETEEISAVIKSTVYYSPDSGYGVVSVTKKKEGARRDPFQQPFTLTGVFSQRPRVGVAIVAKGHWVQHERYGEQFQSEFLYEDIPNSFTDLKYYLEHGLAPGISEELGKRICRQFGSDLPNVMYKDMDRLAEVKGIKDKKLEKIKKLWSEQADKYDAMIFLRNYGISQKMADRIWDTYKERSISVVQENPYRLATEIDGIGFKSADEIALGLGYAYEGRERIQAGIQYIFQTAAETMGHVFLYEEQALNLAAQGLKVRKALVKEQLDAMVLDRDMIREEDRFYAPALYWAERRVAESLLRHCAMRFTQKQKITPAEIEAELNVEYNDDQRYAIEAAGTVGVLVLSGGPGTGKTTTENGIIKKFQMQKKKHLLLAAPTGRAAKRMSEATGGEPARTVHRLLEFNPQTGTFRKNEEDKLSGDLLLIDEASMMDIRLMNSLLRAVPDDMPIVFIGDVDQLPSVGPGRVFGEMIGSGVIPVVRLTKIYRQAEKSAIVQNARGIIKGVGININNKSDFLYKKGDDPDDMANTIVRYFTDTMPIFYGVDISAIQVLCPTMKGLCGTVELNRRIHSVLNGNKPCITHGDYSYSVGDRVMQVKNNYEDETFNGDIGTVVELDPDSASLVVDYGDKEVTYSGKKLGQLMLSYAITVHKSQGSEFDLVIMPMLDYMNRAVLQRNLFYTGVTRAKKKFLLMGTPTAISRSIQNATVQARNTTLCRRLADTGGS